MPKRTRKNLPSKAYSENKHLALLTMGVIVFISILWIVIPNLFTKASNTEAINAPNLNTSSSQGASAINLSEESTKAASTIATIQEIEQTITELEARVTALENRRSDAPPQPQTEPVTYREYTVQPGDYLLKIAYIVYGDASRWPDLVSLNKALYPSLEKYPGLLEIGWVLKY